MSKFSAFCEFLRDTFARENAVHQGELVQLSGTRVGIDVRYVVFLFINAYTKDNEASVDAVVEAFTADLRAQRVRPVFVFGGVEDSSASDLDTQRQQVFSCFWNLNKRRYEADLMKEVLWRKDELKRIRKLHQIVMRSNLNIIEEWIDENLVAALRKRNADFIRAPQLREIQLVSLYEEGLIDAVVGSPLVFLTSPIPHVIADFDFRGRSFSFFSFADFASSLGWQSPQRLKTALKLQTCVFEMDPKLNKNVGLLHLFEEQKLSDILQRQRQFDEMLFERFTALLRQIAAISAANQEDWLQTKAQLCVELQLNAQVFDELLTIVERSLYVSLKTGEVRNTDVRPQLLDLPDYDFALLFALNFVDGKFLSLLSKHKGREFRALIKPAFSPQLLAIFFEFFGTQVARALSNSLTGAAASAFQYRLTWFKKTQIFSFEKPQNHVVTSFHCDVPVSSLSACLKDFARHCDMNQRFVTFSPASNLSQRSIIEHILVKFLEQFGLISLESRSVSALGRLVLRFADSPFFEHLLYFVKLTEFRATFPVSPPVPAQPPDLAPVEPGEGAQFRESCGLDICDTGITNFRKEIVKLAFDVEYGDSFDPLPAEARAAIQQISRVFELVNRERAWTEFMDYDLMQFVLCHNQVRDSFNMAITADILDLVFHTNMKSSLWLLDQASRQLSFQKVSFNGCSALMKAWLAKFVAYTRLLRYNWPAERIRVFISPTHVARMSKVTFDV